MDIKKQQNIKLIKQRLTRLMLLSMIITLLLFAAVIATIIYKVREESKVNILPTQTIGLHKDSQILSQNLNGSNLSLLVKNNDGAFVIIYDYKKAKILTKIKLID